MFEQSFQREQFSGVIKRANPRRQAVDMAQYIYALSRLPAYEMLKDVSTTAGFAMAGPVGEFIEACRHLIEFTGLTLRTEKQTKDGPEVTETPIPWPKATDNPLHIAAAFEFWLDHGDLFDYLKQEYTALDEPNGAAGKPGADVTEQDRANPT